MTRLLALGAVAVIVGCNVPAPQSEVPGDPGPAVATSSDPPRVETADAPTGGAPDTTGGESAGPSDSQPPQLTGNDGREPSVREQQPATEATQATVPTVPPSPASSVATVDTVCNRPELTEAGSYIAPRAKTPVYVAPRETEVPVASIAGGTFVMVTGASGDWLLVRFIDPWWGPRFGYMHCSKVVALQNNTSPDSSATGQPSSR